MLEIQIGFQTSNTSLYSLLAWRRKNNLFFAHKLNVGKTKPQNIWKRMNCLVIACADQTLKKVKVVQQQYLCSEAFLYFSLYLIRSCYSNGLCVSHLGLGSWMCLYLCVRFVCAYTCFYSTVWVAFRIMSLTYNCCSNLFTQRYHYFCCCCMLGLYYFKCCPLESLS